MNEQRILYVSADGLTIFTRRGQTLLHDGNYSHHADSHTDFAAYVARHGDDVFYVLADLAAEGFHSEEIPFLSGRDRGAVVARKLAQTFYGTTLSAAFSQGRSKEGRRNEHVLFAALTQPQALEPWLSLLQQAGADVTGVFSLAQLIAVLAAEASRSRPQLLLTTLTRGGLRQTFFAAGRLCFSRLTAAPAASMPEAAQACAAEAAKTYQYLIGQRLLNRDTPLDVLVLFPPDDCDLVARHCPNGKELRFELFDLHAACRRHGLASTLPDARSDTLFAHLLLRQTPRAQFAPAPTLRCHRLRRIRRWLHGAGAAVFAVCMLLAGKLQLEAQSLADATHALRAENEHDRENLRTAQLALPQAPLSAERLRLSVERLEKLQTLSPGPAPLYRHLGQALQRYPEIELDRLNWRLLDAGDELAHPAGGKEGTRSRAPVVIAEVFARLPAALASDPQAQIDMVEGFSAQLKTAAATSVHTLRPPVDPAVGTVLTSGDGTKAAAPKFALRVVQEFGP